MSVSPNSVRNKVSDVPYDSEKREEKRNFRSGKDPLEDQEVRFFLGVGEDTGDK